MTVHRKERIQRTFWQPFYDRYAHLYDAVDWFTGGVTHRLRRRALAHLPPPPAWVLEVGIGTGRLHLGLAARYTVAGVDLAPGMVQVTQRRLAQHGQTSALCVANVYALPWPDRTFDAVVSTFVVSALPDLERAVGEMARVTEVGGRVVIVDAGPAQDGNRIARGLARLWEWLGDFMRDETQAMAAHGLRTQRWDFGPWNCVHVVVAEKNLSTA